MPKKCQGDKKVSPKKLLSEINLFKNMLECINDYDDIELLKQDINRKINLNLQLISEYTNKEKTNLNK